VGGEAIVTPVPAAGAAYGNRAIGNFYDLVIRVQNIGTAASPRITTGSTWTGDMNLNRDLCTANPLAAGATCDLRVRFYPRTTTASSGTITLSYGPFASAVNVTGAGVVGPAITASPSPTVDFGTVIATTTAERTITVTNTSPTETTGILSYSLTGGARYTIVTGAGGGTCPASGAVGSVLAGGASCTIVVRFAPSQADSTTAPDCATTPSHPGCGTISIGLAGSPALTRTLRGVIGSQLTLTPATASFTTAANTTSAATRFTVTNRGTTAATLITIDVSGPGAPGEWPVSNNTCTALPATGTCTFDVAFAPTSTADRAGVEVRVSNGAYVANVARVAVSTVSGDSQQPAALTITPADGPFTIFPFTEGPGATGGTGVFLGFVQKGTNSAPLTFTVRNTGEVATAALTSSILPFSYTAGCGGAGQTSADYFDILSTTCSGALAGGASCTVTIRSSPPNAGTNCGVSAQWRVTDGAASATGDLLVGTISPFTLFITPSVLDFGEVVAGTMGAPQRFTVTNGSAANQTITTTPSSFGQFNVVANTCTAGLVLLPGDTCTFDVTFNPPLGGPFGVQQSALEVGASSGQSAFGSPIGVSLQPAGLSVTPADVATEFPGTVSGQTSRITYTVANTGGVPTATAPAVDATTGADPGQFRIENNTCTAPLARAGSGAASSCTFDLVFAPTGSGGRSVNLVVNAGGGLTSSRPINGTGIGAALLGISPSAPQTCAPRFAGTGTLDFGFCTTYTITNGGGSPTQPLSLAVTGDFRLQANSTCIGGSGTTIGTTTATGIALSNSGANTCTVIVQHAPQTVGDDSGVLTVGAAGIPSVTGNISSRGLPAFQHTGTTGVAYAENTLTFPSVALGAFSGPVTLNFLNQADPSTGIMTYTITGPNAADFDVYLDNISGSGFPRLGGGNFQLLFVPSGTGTRTATLTITDGTPEKTVTIALTGTGTM
jgi:hypothetical protein